MSDFGCPGITYASGIQRITLQKLTFFTLSRVKISPFVFLLLLCTLQYLACKHPTTYISQLRVSVAVRELQMFVPPSSFLRAQRIKLQLSGGRVMAFTCRASSVAPSVSFHCRNIPLEVIMSCVSCCIQNFSFCSARMRG